MFNRNGSFVPIKEGNTIIFYLNTGGFPLMSDAWSQMWQYAKELQPNAADKLNSLQENKDKIPDVSMPQAPYPILHNRDITSEEKIEKIQNFIDKLQYNHTGLQFYEIRKDRPLIGLADVSRKIIEDCLPIKCLEAVILSIYLINEIPSYVQNNNRSNGIDKFTIGFKTTSKGNIHRHVVLGIYCHQTNLFGALGTSRRSDLGYKKLKFKTLTELLLDYINCYSNYLHRVKRIKIGMPIPCSNRSFETIPWNGCTINVHKEDSSEWPKLVEKHSRSIRHHNNVILNTGNTSNLKQATSLSLRNLTNINQNTTVKKAVNGKSYLDRHLDDLSRRNQVKLRSKSQDMRRISMPINKENLSNNNEDDEDEDEYECDETETIIYSEHESSKQSINQPYMVRTAPILSNNFVRSNNLKESISSLSFIQTTDPSKTLLTSSNLILNSGSTSSSLLRRKKNVTSLRI